MSQNLLFTTVDRIMDPDAPLFQVTSAVGYYFDMTGEMTSRSRWKLPPGAARRMLADSFLTTTDIDTHSALEDLVDAYWSQLLRHIIHTTPSLLLQGKCDVVYRNKLAGSEYRRALGAYGGESSGDPAETGTAHRTQAIPTQMNHTFSHIAPSSGSLGDRKDALSVADAAILMPLTSFHRTRGQPLPWSPIMLIEYQSAQPNVSARVASANLGQLLVAMHKASVHRQCPYGLLCVGESFTRATVHPDNFIEIDVELFLIEDIYFALRRTMPLVGPFVISWRDYLQCANVVQDCYPRLNFFSGRSADPNRATRADSLVAFVQQALDSVHDSMARNTDMVVVDLVPIFGCARLRIMDVNQEESVGVWPSALETPLLTSGASDTTEATGESGKLHGKRKAGDEGRPGAKMAKNDGAGTNRRNMDDPSIPSISEDSTTALILNDVRDRKQVQTIMAHEKRAQEHGDEDNFPFYHSYLFAPPGAIGQSHTGHA